MSSLSHELAHVVLVIGKLHSPVNGWYPNKSARFKEREGVVFDEIIIKRRVVCEEWKQFSAWKISVNVGLVESFNTQATKAS